MTGLGWTKFIWWLAIVALSAPALVSTFTVGPADAQYWRTPWDTDESQPRVRRRQRPPPTPPGNSAYNQVPGAKSPVCLRLEQRLAQEANRGGQARSQLPQIETDMRAARNKRRRVERDLERRGCYETFLFTRSLRRTKTCVRLDREARTLSRQVNDLGARRQQILGRGNRSYQDDIIRELAYNRCGAVYQREARRRNPSPFSSFWQDGDSSDRGYRGNTFAGLPFATYRTLCVRLCDGYYFPVSFSTLPTHFSRDADVCQSQCAAPAELYFHQNPGQAAEHMVSHRSQQPYKSLKSAFRYRKEYVSGCSCKKAEFVPDGGGLAPLQKTEVVPQRADPRAAGRRLSPAR